MTEQHEILRNPILPVLAFVATIVGSQPQSLVIASAINTAVGHRQEFVGVFCTANDNVVGVVAFESESIVVRRGIGRVHLSVYVIGIICRGMNVNIVAAHVGMHLILHRTAQVEPSCLWRILIADVDGSVFVGQNADLFVLFAFVDAEGGHILVVDGNGHVVLVVVAVVGVCEQRRLHALGNAHRVAPLAGQRVAQCLFVAVVDDHISYLLAEGLQGNLNGGAVLRVRLSHQQFGQVAAGDA